MNIIGTVAIRSLCRSQFINFFGENNKESSKTLLNGIIQKNAEDYMLLYSKILKESNGILFRNENELYIVTCYNHVKDNIEIFCEINFDGKTAKIKLNEVGHIAQYDIVVLKIDENEMNDTKIMSSLLNTKNEKKMQFDMSTTHNENLFVQFDNNQKIQCSNTINENSYINSTQFPKIPTIGITFRNIGDEIYKKIGGSLLCSNEYIFGMLLHVKHDNDICCIPAYCLNLFVDIILKNTAVTNILIDSAICDISNNESDNKMCNLDNQVGHYVKNGFGVAYNTSDGKKFRFNKGDVLLTVNKNKFNQDGTIKLRDMNIDVPLDTYITLSNDRYIDIYYYRDNKRKDSMCLIQIEKKDFNELIIFDQEQNKNFIEYKGLIITELSEELYAYYTNMGINFVGIVKHYYKHNITNVKKKIVVIIDVNQSSKNTDNKSMAHVYENIGLPFIKTKSTKKNDYYFSVIKTFNDKHVLNLDCLKQMIKEENERDNKNDKTNNVPYINTMKIVTTPNTSYTIHFTTSSI